MAAQMARILTQTLVHPRAGVWLGEAAMTLTRNVDFEVPALRKAAARAQQQLVDLQRRREEFLHSASTAAAAYKQVLARRTWNNPHGCCILRWARPQLAHSSNS